MLPAATRDKTHPCHLLPRAAQQQMDLSRCVIKPLVVGVYRKSEPTDRVPWEPLGPQPWLPAENNKGVTHALRFHLTSCGSGRGGLFLGRSQGRSVTGLLSQLCQQRPVVQLCRAGLGPGEVGAHGEAGPCFVVVQMSDATLIAQCPDLTGS